MQEEISKVGKQAVEEMKSVQEHLKRFDSKWREERKRLQDQIRTLQNQIRTFDKQRADDRKTLQEELRQKATAVRDQLRNLGR